MQVFETFQSSVYAASMHLFILNVLLEKPVSDFSAYYSSIFRVSALISVSTALSLLWDIVPQACNSNRVPAYMLA